MFSLNNGEQPYGNNGYLIFQDEQVRVLFNSESIQSSPKSLSEKTNCWILQKAQIKKVTKETVYKSIHDLLKWCDKELREAYKERIYVRCSRPMIVNGISTFITVTKKQKTILKAFGIDAVYVKSKAWEIMVFLNSS